MIFYKTVSSGNDFIHIDVDEWKGSRFSIAEPASLSRLVRRICERQTGAGADGVVFYRVEGETVHFEIYNRDGGEAELSGNGMAGLTALLFHLEKFSHVITLRTRVGIKTHHYVRNEGSRYRLKIEIGEPDFHNRLLFPFMEDKKSSYTFNGIQFYPVSVGNPHAVVLLSESASDEMLEVWGRRLEGAEIFPFRTNVEFIVPSSSKGLNPDYDNGKGFRIYFYERGVGPTFASSTGSSAVYAVLRNLGLTREQLVVPGSVEKEQVIVSGKHGIIIENTTEVLYKGEYLAG